MSLQTDFNVAPYYDDYDPAKNFYRVLFQPGVAVQARELNQLQTILQAQVEKFGDNIFKRGTIIEGCNITLHQNLPYVKIKDTEVDGTKVNVSLYDNLTVRNSAGVTGYITKTTSGFESRSPDLNTLFVKYNSSGSDSNTSTFAAGETLTVFDPTYPIFKVRVNDGSTTFSNSDTVVFTSAIAIQNSSGGTTFSANAFMAGHVIQNGVANATIVEANSTANSEYLVLKIKPLAADLKTANTILWRFNRGDSIVNVTSPSAGNTAVITDVVGSGAAGVITTDSLGKILDPIAITAGGSGYYVPPYVSIQINNPASTITTTEIDQLSTDVWNYLTNVTVAPEEQIPIGFGYGMTVDEGTIYQKGYFSRVDQQLTIVNKYSNTGFNKSVGFYTTESIINSNQDSSLLDNATGTYNYAAPGADRLKLTPALTVLDKTAADLDPTFLPIVEFADGRPYKQNRSTVYNVIGDEMAKRTYEESGNYVLDPFYLSTKESSTFADNATLFKINIDPGKAYVKGYRVERVDNYQASVNKGTTTSTNTSAKVRLGYGNFIRVKCLGGIFEYNTGAQINLYDTAATYISSSAGSTPAAPAGGNLIGTARLRSLVLESGEPGTANATYRLYLFEIVMSAGKNFANVRSVFYDGTNKGIADVVLTNGDAILVDTASSSLLFSTVDATSYAQNISYTYRTLNQALTANSAGKIRVPPTSGYSFPYNGNLSSSERAELTVIPLQIMQASANASGTVSTTSACTVITGSSTNFQTAFKAGDYIKVANATASEIKQISQITSATSMICTNAVSASFPGGSYVRLYFPANVPISLSNRTALIESNGQLTINVGNNLVNATGSSASLTCAVGYNSTITDTAPSSKISNRNAIVRVKTSSNPGGVRGPWALGVSDVYRLRAVYIANGASRAVSVNANTGVLNSGTANAFLSLPNNVFANGDSVVYSNTGMTTGITGLSNGGTYYAVFANSLGMALSSTRNGANLTLTASATSENHTLTGAPTYFTENTYGVTEVTNDFYIDINQKEDYLDTSYLYRKPRNDTLSSNDVLLVRFDVFTGSAGVKTVTSYPVDDSLTFTSLVSGASINTMEIPEMIGDGGKYYDLRDQFDFRPTSANTIPILTGTSATDISNTALLNPTEPSDANRFAGGEKYFPAPDTTLTANIAYYLGRNDRVIIDKNSNFVVRSGVAALSPVVPTQPDDSLTLQILQIPPYPSFPAALSADTVKIIDTKVANEVYGKRRNKYTIQTNLDLNAISRIQIKNYKMADIASLEKRIKDLEYYVSFSFAEALAQSKFIPSSANALIDRFRYGFFVDPFTDYNYADVGNPEFFATISNNMLGPKLNELNLEFKPDGGNDGIITLPYTEYTVINQNDATDGYVSGPITLTTVTQSTASVRQSQRTTNGSDSGSVYEEFYYTFSSLTGPVKFFINHLGSLTSLEVFQSASQNGPWTSIDTSSAALPINSTDIGTYNLYGLDNGHQFWALGGAGYGGNIHRIGEGYYGIGPAGGFIWDQYKLFWTHDPAQGQYIKLRLYKASTTSSYSKGHKYQYEFKLIYPSDAISTQTTIVKNPAGFQYKGTVATVSPSEFTVMQGTNYLNIWAQIVGLSIPYGIYVADSQKFIISVTGLKPNTYHKFMFNNEDKTSSCVQVRTNTTNSSGLLSDSNGVITFDFYYDAGINEAATDLALQNKIIASLAGTKTFSVESIDQSSIAYGSIGLKYYTAIDPSLYQASTLNLTQSTSAIATSTPTTNAPSSNPLLDVAINDAISSKNTTTINFGGGYISNGLIDSNSNIV